MRGYIALTISFQREKGDLWTAECLELGTSTFGNSFEDVNEKIDEAILLHLNTLEEVGERKRFFEEHNINIIYYKPKTISVPTTKILRKNTFIQPRLQRIPSFV